MSMIRRAWIVYVPVVASLSLGVPAFAQGTADGKAGTPAKPAAPAEKPGEPAKATAPAEGQSERPAGGKEATGRLVSVSPNKKTLVVDANGKKMTFWVAEPAAKDLAKVKRGDRVKVRYTDEGGQLTAQEVTKG